MTKKLACSIDEMGDYKLTWIGLNLWKKKQSLGPTMIKPIIGSL
jgi:hypothetical protein